MASMLWGGGRSIAVRCDWIAHFLAEGSSQKAQAQVMWASAASTVLIPKRLMAVLEMWRRYG